VRTRGGGNIKSAWGADLAESGSYGGGSPAGCGPWSRHAGGGGRKTVRGHGAFYTLLLASRAKRSPRPARRIQAKWESKKSNFLARRRAGNSSNFSRHLVSSKCAACHKRVFAAMLYLPCVREYSGAVSRRLSRTRMCPNALPAETKKVRSHFETG